MTESPIQYFPTAFETWNAEAQAVLSYVTISPDGIDVGCGRRSLHQAMFRVDKNPAVEPDLVADAQDLSAVPTASYDYYWSSHNIEHCPDTAAVLREAARVVKPGGYVVLIIPDQRYTAGRDPTHVHEWLPEEYIGAWARPAGLQLADFGVAGREWSFRVVYQVAGAHGEGITQPLAPEEEIIRAGLAELNPAPRDWAIHPLRMLAMSDHPRLTTGFGTVLKQLCQGFHQALFDLSVLGTWEFRGSTPGEFPYYVEPVCPHDYFGLQKLRSFIQERAPEVFFSLADPSTQWTRLQALIPGFGASVKVQGFRPPCPIVMYMPIEGYPIAEPYLEVIRTVQSTGGRVVVYTQCQADQVQEESGGELTVDWAYHGSNHGPFRPYPDAERARLRELVGWDDRFVVINVARNKRTSRQPEYIKAAAILKELGHTDVLFYLHCDPSDEYGIQNMQGWDLEPLARRAGVFGHTGDDFKQNIVLFPPSKLDQTHGVPLHRRQQLAEASTNPNLRRGIAMENLSFIDRLNLGDIYMDASSVQGFGLPAVEAARCGLPLFVTDDQFTRREILGEAPRWMKPASTDTWQTGATLHLVTAEEIVKQVLWAKANPAALAEMRQASIERAALLTWKPTQDKFVRIVKEVAGHE
ncbi:MAG: methyltransferase domain-containing protein [Chloroflexi bacterium]|nr:methyltransferase domain-containing protein [Chloroflexota bacterium]